MKLINKDVLVAEIERLASNGKVKCQQSQKNNDQLSYIAWSEHIATCGKILSIIDTLEVKEVDLEKIHYKPLDEDFERDAVSFCLDNGLNTTPHIAKIIAKHFFELGLKAQKGEQK